MGKDKKKKKFTAPKPQPTGLPSVREAESSLEIVGNTSAATPSTLQSLVERLQSPYEETRECACTTVASLVSEPGAISGLMKLNIVKILAPLVLDNSWDIRHRALGALRNISVDGGDTACQEMVKEDVLTPLLAFIKQFDNNTTQAMGEEKCSKKMIDVIHEAYTHAFYLLLYLCECTNMAVQTFTQENLVSVVCAILQSADAGDNLRLAVAEFLQTVTEDNSAISRPELVECIHKLMLQPANTSIQVLMKTLATGILVNLEGSKLSPACGDLLVPIVTAVAEVLCIEASALLMTLDFSQNGMEENGTEPETESEGNSKKSPVTDKLRDLENILKAQKIALEIATNLCCADDEEWEDMDNSESSSDDGAEMPMEEEMADNNAAVPLSVSTELHSAYVGCEIVQKVLQAAQPLTVEQSQRLGSLPEGGEGITERFLMKQTNALLCINNLVSSLDPGALGGVTRLCEMWEGLLRLAKDQQSIQSQTLLEAATSALRAVIQKLAELDPSKFEQVTPPDLQFMYEMSTKCQWSEVRVNSLRIVSTIGSILAKNTTPHPLLKDIGLFLLEIVCKDSDLWVVGEALDAIFDVFGEDHTDPLAREIDLVSKLKAVAPILKGKVQSNKKALGEHYPVISTARNNLIRFIKYKSTH